MTETLSAAIAGALVALIFSFLEAKKLKKILSMCVADESCTDTFIYKDKLYSKKLYIDAKVKVFEKMNKKDLARSIKSYQKSKEKGKLSEIQLLDFEAMQLAQKNK